MIRAFRELRAYRAALTELARCDFIQAQAATKGTCGEKLVVGVIVRMVNIIDSRTEVEERLDSVLNFYGLEEPTAEELRAAFEHEPENRLMKRTVTRSEWQEVTDDE